MEQLANAEGVRASTVATRVRAEREAAVKEAEILQGTVAELRGKVAAQALTLPTLTLVGNINPLPDPFPGTGTGPSPGTGLDLKLRPNPSPHLPLSPTLS